VESGSGGNGGNAYDGSSDAGGNGGDSGDVTGIISGHHFFVKVHYQNVFETYVSYNIFVRADAGSPGFGGSGDSGNGAPDGDPGQYGSAIAVVDDNVVTTVKNLTGLVALTAVTESGEQQDADVQGNHVSLWKTPYQVGPFGLGVDLDASTGGGDALVSQNTVQTGPGPHYAIFEVDNYGNGSSNDASSGNLTLTDNQFTGGPSPDNVTVAAATSLDTISNLTVSGNNLDGGGGDNPLTLFLDGLSVPIIADLKSDTLAINGGANTITHFRNVDASETTTPVELIGDNATNKLTGGLGNDILEGGGGRDILTGGFGGDDRFVYAKITDSTTSAPDLITDFHAGDVIDLHLIDANPGLPGRQSFHFEAANTDGGDVRVYYDAAQNVTDVVLYLHGDTHADGLIQLAGQQTLTAADFIF